MKLVPESLNEINFERGIDPKFAMDIGKRALIKKWFDDLDISPDEYNIDKNLHISFKLSLFLMGEEIISLPDNLSIGGSLDLFKSKITSLPDNLSVEGFLDLRRTQIASLPDNLKVKGNILKDF